jgi:hypothetical protein
VEFALVLPVMLLLVLFGIDFGRIFLGWVELNNVVREAADFAAENPTAWNTVNPNAAVQTQYQNLVTNEAARINCTMPTTIPAPTFSGGPNVEQAIGTPVFVRISCRFSLITPIIGAFFGGSLPVAASASYPTRNGMIPNIPMASVTPMPSPTPSPSPSPSPTPSPTPSATPTGGPTATPTPAPTATPAPTPTPTPMCDVPNFMSPPGKASDAAAAWASAGFTTQVIFSPLNPGKSDKVTSQSIISGASRPCTSTGITVYW